MSSCYCYYYYYYYICQGFVTRNFVISVRSSECAAMTKNPFNRTWCCWDTEHTLQAVLRIFVIGLLLLLHYFPIKTVSSVPWITHHHILQCNREWQCNRVFCFDSMDVCKCHYSKLYDIQGTGKQDMLSKTKTRPRIRRQKLRQDERILKGSLEARHQAKDYITAQSRPQAIWSPRQSQEPALSRQHSKMHI